MNDATILLTRHGRTLAVCACLTMVTGSGLAQLGSRAPSAGPGRFSCRNLLLRELRVVKTRDGHLVEASVHLLRRDQISHRSFERLVPHPVLNSADIESCPEGA